MNYSSVYEHNGGYLIDGVHVNVIANFLQETIYISWPSGKAERPMEEYVNYGGNMEEFAAKVYRGRD